MYIFGGSNGKSPLNDTFCFNFPTRTWTRVMISGEIPSPREGHSAVGLNDKYILVFGGWNGKTIFNNFYLFDTEVNEKGIIKQKIIFFHFYFQTFYVYKIRPIFGNVWKMKSISLEEKVIVAVWLKMQFMFSGVKD